MMPWKRRAGFPNLKRRKNDKLSDERMATRPVKAISIGPAALKILKKGAISEVHSTFERAFSVLIGDKLVGIARGDVLRSPFNIIADFKPNISMRSLVRKGAKVSVAGDLLRVGDELTISLKGAEVWRPGRAVAKALDVESVKRNLLLAKRLAGGRKEGLGQLAPHIECIISGASPDDPQLNQVSRAALPHIAALASAVRSGDLELVRRSVKNLVGLGPGLSPSADDMLSGLMAGLRWAVNSSGGDVDRVDEVNRTIVDHVAGDTTSLSRQLLEHAARGEANEVVEGLLKTILAGEAEDVKVAVEKVLAMGETSGVDISVGILLGLSIGMDFHRD